MTPEFPSMTERLAIAHIGHRGDGIADTAEGPVYIPCTLPGETVETERFPGHPDRRLLLRIVEPSPGSHRADLPAFRDLRRLRAAALGGAELSRMEARSRCVRSGQSADRGAGRRIDRRAWRGPQAHGAACAARHERRAGSRILGVALAHHRADRPLPGAGAGPRRRDSDRLDDRGNAQDHRKTP